MAEVAASDIRCTLTADSEIGTTTIVLCSVPADAREGAGLTQTELAARIGIAQSALSRIEAGRTNLTLGMFRRIAEALGVDVALEVGSHRVIVAPAA
jgi:DNA-binding XRE family transcriptional regulator